MSRQKTKEHNTQVISHYLISAFSTRASVLTRGLLWRIPFIKAYLPVKLRLLTLKQVVFIGITGSAGKTTTKDITAFILSASQLCQKSTASYNEPLWVAETVRRTTREHRYSVVEMTGSEPNIMDRCLRYLRPKIAVVTNIGHDHHVAFGSKEGIAAEKGKLIHSLSARGVAILNIDDPLVRSMADCTKAKIIWVGRAEGATLRLCEISSQWPKPLTLKVEYQNTIYEVNTQLYGTHLATSVLAALGVAIAVNLPLEDAICTLAKINPTEGRMQVVEDNDGVVFIRDDWKSPEWSLQAPIDFLKMAKATRKIAVIGTVSDSSTENSRRYPAAARVALDGADKVIFVGLNSAHALRAKESADDNRILAFINIAQAAAYLKTELRRGDLVLLKGNNPTDHLSRIYLDRIGAVQCWRNESQCDISLFCSVCPKLNEPFKQLAKISANDLVDATTPIIIGLGNTGQKYTNTPHNVGFMVLDKVANQLGGQWVETPHGLVASMEFKGKTFQMLKPNGFINNSGTAISSFFEMGGFNPARCLIVHDDIARPLGKTRHKVSGGDGGHRGVRSLIYILQTNAIHRLKIGINDPETQQSTVDFVVSQLAASQLSILSKGVDEASTLVLKFVNEGGQPKDNLRNKSLKTIT